MQSGFSATGTLGYSRDVYLPAAFHESQTPLMHELMRAYPLATVVTMHEGAPAADHIPMQLVAAPEPLGMLRGHVARANPLWRQHAEDQEALVVFQGPQAYVSPSFYPTKQLTGEVVPTWNYAVVHVHGKLSFIHDRQWLLELVESLTDAHEASRAKPWKVADAPPAYIDKMLGAIVGFEFVISRMIGKWKVSQNRNAADRQGVVDGLRATHEVNARAIADLVQRP